MLWIYLRRNESYLRLRNTLFVVNAIGLVGYVALPTAPPRLVLGGGFIDTLSGSDLLNHSSRIVELAANPYAAMPSLHAADAVVVGVALAAAVRSRPLKVLFLLWPIWVGFSLVVTGNHFWIDVAVGAALGAAGILAAGALKGSLGGAARGGESRRRSARSPLSPRHPAGQ